MGYYAVFHPDTLTDLMAELTPKEKWKLTPDTLKSKSHNSPFLNQTMTGLVVATLVAGRLVYEH